MSPPGVPGASVRYAVFIAAEGPSEIGDLAGAGHWRPAPRREGYFQPMLRKLLGEDVTFEGRKITLLGRFEARRKLPGHADRAAKALALASELFDDCRVVVFAHDVDKTSGEKRSRTEARRRLREIQEEIESGFAEVRGAEHLHRVKATPLRMLESWALGDRQALADVSEGKGGRSATFGRPEETWGDESDHASGHPKCVLRRVLGHDPSAEDFAEIAARSIVETVCATCPESFAPFAKETQEAGDRARKDALVGLVMDR